MFPFIDDVILVFLLGNEHDIVKIQLSDTLSRENVRYTSITVLFSVPLVKFTIILYSNILVLFLRMSSEPRIPNLIFEIN